MFIISSNIITAYVNPANYYYINFIRNIDTDIFLPNTHQ